MLEWAKHEVLQPPTLEEIALMEPRELITLHRDYHQAIANAKFDPYTYGYKPPHWSDADLLLEQNNEVLVSGGNRSSKSIWATYCVHRAAIANPKSKIMCWCQNQNVSNSRMQAWVYEWMPPEYRKKVTTSGAYVKYTHKNGFTGDSFIYPNGSQIFFHHYSQWSNDDTMLEGAELGCKNPSGEFPNVGIWLDEYLIGPSLLDTVVSRLATFNAKAIITFTPVDGYTEVVGNYMAGAKTIKRSYACELKPPRDVQYIQESTNRENAGIIYFHSIMNPFGGYERLASDYRNKPESEKLIRLYGIPTKSFTTQFPKFSEDVNVIPTDKIPTEGVTRYCILDPADKKNWFFLWIAVDADEVWYVYHEWPGIEHDDWGAWKDGKWKPGPAAKGLGYGIKDYVNLIKEIEGQDEIFERLIDPRFGNRVYSTKEGASSIIQELSDEDMIFVPAPGGGVDDGLQLINDKLSYDPDKPKTYLNRPHLYISEECEQLIKAMAEYTGEGGKAEAWKDPIDCYDEETELLTDRGWIRFADYKDELVATQGGEGYLEWQKPTEYISRHYEGDMIGAEGKGCDFLVTPNHRMVVYPQKSGKTVIRPAKDLYRQDTIPIATKGVKPGGYLGQWLWFELLGIYMGDGCASGNMGGKIQIPGRGYSVYISQSRDVNPSNCERIEFILEQLGYKWAYRNNSYCISNKSLWEKLIGLGNCYTKELPSYVYTSTREELEALLKGLKRSDGWDAPNGTMRYCSVSKKLASGVQAVMQLLGKPTGCLYERPVKVNPDSRIQSTTEQYWASTRKGDRCSITNGHKEMLAQKVPYSGMVYCVTVPNSIIVVRRNGKAMVCGNCLRYAAVSGIDHVPLQSATVKKSGGY